MTPTDFLQLSGKTILVFGVANKKSVAWHIGRVLAESGTSVVYAVRSEARRASLAKLLPDAEIHVCDVERPDEIARLQGAVAARHGKIQGLVHSIAFADYEG